MAQYIRQRSPSQKFWDRISNFYARKEISDPEAYEVKLADTQALLNQNMRVLEIGCGTGMTALLHAPYVRHIHAVDYSNRMIQIADKKLENSNTKNVSFECADFDNFVRPAASFDAILGLNFLHLMQDTPKTLNQIHTLLKPGGIFVSSTECVGDMPRTMRAIAYLGATLGILPRVQSITASGLKLALGRSRFEFVKSRSFGGGKSLFIIAQKPKEGHRSHDAI